MRAELVRAELRHAFDKADEGRSGRISREGFTRACAQLHGVSIAPGASIDPADPLAIAADAIFSSYASEMLDLSGGVPIPSLIDALVASQRNAGTARAGMAANVRAAGNADAKPIKYARCRTGVFAPSAWSESSALARRSHRSPDARLELEAVYGYGGLANAAPNLFYSSRGELVYYTAAVGIVLEAESHSQRFFLGHTDDIHCLALDPTRTLAASGQQADRDLGGRPFACVWDVHTMHEYARLVHGKVNRVAAVGFSRDGAWLATVGCSAPQAVHVWDWRAGAMVFEMATGIQPAPRDVEGQTVLTNVFGVRWAPVPHSVGAFVTHGKSHLHLWQPAPRPKGGLPAWQKEAGIFDPAPVGDVLCVEFLPSGDLVSGTGGGEVLVWRGRKVAAVVRAHGGEVRVLLALAGGSQMLSASSRGVIHLWDLPALHGDASDDSAAADERLPVKVADGVRRLPSAYEGQPPPSIRALDAYPGSSILAVGTARCDIWQVDADPEILVAGHVADLIALDVHPLDSSLFVTAGSSDRLHVWDASSRRPALIASVQLDEEEGGQLGGGVKRRLDALVGAAITCMSWAPPKGALIGVGAASKPAHPVGRRQGHASAAAGCLALFHAANLAPAGQVALSSQPSALRFTSDGMRVAVGTHAGTIELFALLEPHEAAERGAGGAAAGGSSRGQSLVLHRLGVCSGHSSTVRSLDWSADDALLQSSCQAYELLYWDGLSAEQVRHEQRDREWQTWSSVVGWPVMGIWPPDYDNTDINALDRSEPSAAAAHHAAGVHGGYVVVADDFGRVLLFNYPCVAADAPYLRYRGHSSHVTGVRFLRGSQRCVSIGGHDRAAFQWSVWSHEHAEAAGQRAAGRQSAEEGAPPTEGAGDGQLLPTRGRGAAAALPPRAHGDLVRARTAAARQPAAPGVRAQSQLVIAPRAAPQSVESQLERAVLALTPRYAAAGYMAKLAAKLTRHSPADQADALGEEATSKLLSHFGIRIDSSQFAQLAARYPAAQAEGALSCTALAACLFAIDARRRTRPQAKSAPQRLPGESSTPVPISHARCRTRLHPPSQGAASALRRSEEPPDARLELEAVYGYGGLANAAPNLFYSSRGELVYYTAAVGIVLEAESHSQRFFLGHTDDIHCLALDPTRTLAASGQQADRELGGRPFACVWDVHTMHEYARLVHGKVNRVAAVGFSRDGAWLATVGCSAPQAVHVWDWRAGAMVFEMATGIQPAPRDVEGQTVLTNVFGVRWAPVPHSVGAFVTHGKSHLHLWQPAPRPKGGLPAWQKEAGIFDPAPVGDVLCVEFLPSGDLVSGMPNGDLYVWRQWRVLRALRAHAAEVRVLLLRANGHELLSAGTGGLIHQWDVSGNLPVRQAEATRHLHAPYAGEKAPSIRALDTYPGSSILAVGTARCDIWQVDADPEILVAGHVADLIALDVHPLDSSLFVSAGRSDRAFVWDAGSRRLHGITHRLAGESIRCLSWAPPTGDVIGIASAREGLASFRGDRGSTAGGSVFLVDATGADGAMDLLCSAALGAEPSAMRFTSDGRRLAVGTLAGTIELLAVRPIAGGYALHRLGVCSGHSSTVRSLDWSADDALLQSSCQAYELLYWDGLSAEQVRHEQRDREWQTWSSVVGWPVMGIWPPDYDNTDINALDRSEPSAAAAHHAAGVHGGYVVVADDFGRVLLFNYPCVAADAPYLRYRGHSSHVTGVRFLRGSQRCVSIGGHDRAVFQWALVPTSSSTF